MRKPWCRFCNVWQEHLAGHVCDPEDLRKHVVLLDNRAADAEAAVDYLRELLAQVRPRNCDGLHHPKADQHEGDEPCPILARIDAAVTAGHSPDCAIALNAGLHRTEPAAGSGTVRGLVGNSESSKGK
jgi:hypothetical protein